MHFPLVYAQMQIVEAILGPVLGYSDEILNKRLFTQDTESNLTYTTYLAYSIGKLFLFE